MADTDSALIAESGSLLGTALNIASQDKGRKKSAKIAKDLMSYQNDLNIANWQRENEYNSPQAEISRLRAAGINPDLFYSSNGSLGGSSVPSVGLGSSDPGNVIPTDFGQGTLRSRQLDISEDLANSQIQKNLADANNTNAYTPWVSEQVKSMLELNTEQTKVLNETVEKIRSETELNKINYAIQNRVNDFEEVLYNHRVTAEIESLGATAEQARTIVKEYSRFYAAQINEAISQSYANYVNADSQRTNAQANMINARTGEREFGLHKIESYRNYNLAERQHALDKAFKQAGIDTQSKQREIMDLQNQWRTMLNSTGIIGEAIHGILSIPVSALGGLF